MRASSIVKPSFFVLKPRNKHDDDSAKLQD